MDQSGEPTDITIHRAMLLVWLKMSWNHIFFDLNNKQITHLKLFLHQGFLYIKVFLLFCPQPVYECICVPTHIHLCFISHALSLIQSLVLLTAERSAPSTKQSLASLGLFLSR